MLDISTYALVLQVSNLYRQAIFGSIKPNNIIADVSNLRVITSILAGLRAIALNLIALLRSVNTISVQVLSIVLNLAPLVLICLIAGAVSTINAEIVVALLNFTICVFLTAIASLGISRLVFRRFTTSNERSSLTSNPVDSVFFFLAVNWK